MDLQVVVRSKCTFGEVKRHLQYDWNILVAGSSIWPSRMGFIQHVHGHHLSRPKVHTQIDHAGTQRARHT